MAVGAGNGTAVGPTESAGTAVGAGIGTAVGAGIGTAVGPTESVGTAIDAGIGTAVGPAGSVGMAVGAGIGTSVTSVWANHMDSVQTIHGLPVASAGQSSSVVVGMYQLARLLPSELEMSQYVGYSAML